MRLILSFGSSNGINSRYCVTYGYLKTAVGLTRRLLTGNVSAPQAGFSDLNSLPRQHGL